MNGFESLKDSLFQINDITNSILGIAPATNDPNALTAVINTILAPVNALQNDELFSTNKIILTLLLRQQDEQLNSINKSFEGVVDSFVSINSSLNKLNSIEISDSNTTVTQILSNIKSVSEQQFNLKKFNVNIDAFDKLTSSIEKFYNINTSGASNFKEGVDKAIEFTNTISNAKLENLQTASNIFQKMSEFSKSISGNFEGLADTINDKIMPLLEKLNDALGETNKHIESGKFNTSNSAGNSTSTSTTATSGATATPTGAPGNNNATTTVSRDYSSIIGEIKKELESVEKILADGVTVVMK